MTRGLEHLRSNPGFLRLREILGDTTDLADETLQMIADAAAIFGENRLASINAEADKGCVLENGKVRTPAGFRQAWADMVSEGWTAIDLPVQLGGSGLPLCVQSLCQEEFDRGCVAFGMLLTPQRGGFALLSEYAPTDVQEEWLPRMAAGEWSTTICVSEPDAGSDVGRIRTLAEPVGGGMWEITGEKCWISFGAHDLTQRIGHCVLARTRGAPAGGRGLSLFLVPNSMPGSNGSSSDNGVFIRRIEEKLGLHGSPTCSIGFEKSQGWLIGEQGRGLAQMFTMIGIMRQSVGVQGLGVASAASDIAWRYARERRQGGPPEAPPTPISAHADVQRMLMDMAARVEMLRGVVLALAVQMDLAANEPDETARSRAGALAQWLMPIAKTYGAETATWAASTAIQVLGGAGYTRDWPVEQLFRDSRVFSIYEGTSGIQALDLLHRRLWRDRGAGLSAFVEVFEQALSRLQSADAVSADRARQVLRRLTDTAERLNELRDHPIEAEACATAFLELASLAATAYVAICLRGSTGEARLAALAEYWLSHLDAAAAHAEQLALADARTLSRTFEQTIAGA